MRPPAKVVRHDGDDPYLVVAADKGTATFSDIANALAQEYGFWLDDAFASGGSAGYDHKKMGITARGAWESVKRHFRELGQDIQTTPFTVAGVGDMSGDVFGNGMLLSQHIKLLAAFDHRHIFIDPMPDPATSLAERKRLFDLPRSSWMDYDKSLLSAGGGIYDRAAKSIALSAEAQQVLGIEAPAMTPVDLMRAILTAPVDLLYFGGIGTYVKASSESQADAGDRANDAIRVNADQLRAARDRRGRQSRLHPARPGRGGAGRTQDQHRRARQFGRRRYLRPRGQHQDRDRRGDHPRPAGPRRPRCAAVLDDRRGRVPGAAPQLPAEPGDQRRRRPGGRGARPAGALHARAGAPGPARPRRRIPAGHGGDARARAQTASISPGPSSRCCWPTPRSISTTRSCDSDLPDDPLLEGELLRYFPTALQEKYEPAIRAHRLRREIAALQVVNSLINRCGPTFVRNIGLRTGAPAAAIARAFAVVRDAWKLRDLWGDIEALDPALKAEAQIRMLVASQRFLTRVVQWTLRRLPQPLDTMAATEQLGAAVAALGDLPPALIGEAESAALAERAAAFEAMGAPAGIARRAAALETLAAAGDLMQAARANGCSIEDGDPRLFPAGRAAVARQPGDGGAEAAARGPVAGAGGAAPCRTSLRRCMPIC